jgi:phosphoribosylaminoimidazole-succinocarboxamide synthase
MPQPLTNLELPGIKKLRSGKVREVFDLGETLLFVATDRISAFDCILPDPIPHKGAVLNQLSAFWFQRFTFVPNHMIAAQFNLPPGLEEYREQLIRRSMIVRKAEPLPVECVVRGYLAGLGLEGIPGARQRRRPQTAARPRARVAIARSQSSRRRRRARPATTSTSTGRNAAGSSAKMSRRKRAI